MDNTPEDIKPYRPLRKKNFRQHAHDNPFATNINHYRPNIVGALKLDQFFTKPLIDDSVKVVDVGCGYGAFLVLLSSMFPEKLVLGLEIRSKVSEYTRQLLLKTQESNLCFNAAVCRTNAMMYFTKLFRKNQLHHIFILYPDPHFKNSKKRMRIISDSMVAEYAYTLKPGGFLYTVTDIEEYHTYSVSVFFKNKLFKRLTPQEIETNHKKIFDQMMYGSDESRKLNLRNSTPMRFGLIYQKL